VVAMKEAKQHPGDSTLWIMPDGRVFQELTVYHDSNGYSQVAIGKRGARGNVRRHVLVCETFHGPRPLNAVVRHKNGKPGDDREDNLEWGTQEENLQDAVRHGTTTKGSKNARAILTEEQVVEIKQRLRAGEGTSSLADWFYMSKQAICDIRAGRTWSHIS